MMPKALAGQWGIVLNSINLGLAVTAATTLLSVPIAWAMVRFDFSGKSIFSGLLLVPLVLPPFVGAVGMRQMFARFGSINLLLLDAGLIGTPIEDLTVVNGDAIALLKGAPHREVATRFIEVVLSEEGQKLWILRQGEPDGPQGYELDKFSVLPGLYAKIEGRTSVRLNPFAWNSDFVYDADKGGATMDSVQRSDGNDDNRTPGDAGQGLETGDRSG